MPGLPALVFIVFLVLKLTETTAVAGWSWWWVTSPLWIAALVGIVAMVPMFLFGAWINRR